MPRKLVFAIRPTVNHSPLNEYKIFRPGFREFTKTPLLPGKLFKKIKENVAGNNDCMDLKLEQSPISTQHMESDQLQTSIIKIGNLSPTQTVYANYEVTEHKIIKFKL